jgi:hypothetical protein
MESVKADDIRIPGEIYRDAVDSVIGRAAQVGAVEERAASGVELDTKPSLLPLASPPNVGWIALVLAPGKPGERVVPPTYALPSPSTAIAPRRC